ncbi:MAG: glycosyltransferase family 2 protein [Myxococcota bacterium]
MKLLVALPALNEAATIGEVIAAIPAIVPAFDTVDVVVVDDGSTDETGTKAAAAGATVVRHPQNRGVGAAFQTMVQFALMKGADVMVTIDADGQFDPNHIPTLVAPIIDGHAWMVTASRFSDPALIPQMPWIKKWGNRRVANLVNMLTGRRYADVSCGYRAYTRDALLRLTVYHAFTYTHETLIDLASKQVAIAEVPLEIRGVRAVGESRVASSVWRYGVRTAGIMLRTYRDQRPLQLCGWLALLFALGGTGFLIASLRQFYLTGVWLKWAAFTGAAAGALAVTLLFFGFMLDIVTRLRRNQEETLFWVRRAAYLQTLQMSQAASLPPKADTR